MIEKDRTRLAAVTRSEERSLLTRAAYDSWVDQCRREGLPAPGFLPWNFAPVERKQLRQIIEARRLDPEARRLQQSVNALAPAGSGDDLVRLSITDSAALARYDRDVGDQTLCSCCARFRAGMPEDSLWDMRHKHHNGTWTQFDSSSQITTITSTLLIQSRRDPVEAEVASLMASLAEQFDPSKWKDHGKESFRRSDPISRTPGIGGGWSGTLLEEFDWSWNPQSTVSIENVLSIDYRVGPNSINLDYGLKESLSSKLWLARQAGGLDIDRGVCQIVNQGWREVVSASDPVQRAIAAFESDDDYDKSQKVFVALNHAAPSPTYNIVILAKKIIRFTGVEGGPPWFGGLMNYLSPIMGSIWMSRAVHAGAWQAIGASIDQSHPLMSPPLRPNTGLEKDSRT